TADLGTNPFSRIPQFLTCSSRQLACADKAVDPLHERAKLVAAGVHAAAVQAQAGGGELVQQTVAGQQAFRDQSSNVVHEEFNGCLRSGRSAQDTNSTPTVGLDRGGPGGRIEESLRD